jgi:hypothetical protein
MAHPPIGLVYDGLNTIYYTDLDHIWKLDTRTGISEIYRENIHSHELFLDEEGNLYGEHYWYAESEGQFKNYLWKISINSIFQIIRDEQIGENKDFSFVKDSNFSNYKVVKTSKRFQIVKSDSISKQIWHNAQLNDPSWSSVNKNKELLFVDFPKIYRANQSQLIVLAKDASAYRFPFNIQDDKHNIYGLWTDQDNNTYTAVYGGRQIKKIDANGNISRIYTSSFLWSPVNGVFDKNGDLWVMECRIGGAIRIKRIKHNELTNSASFAGENITFALVLLFITYILFTRFKKLWDNRVSS